MLADGDAEGALARLLPLATQAAEMDLRPRTIAIQEVRSRALRQLGRAEEAIAAVDAVLMLTEELGIRTVLWRLYGSRAAALTALGRHDEAALDREAAAAIVFQMADTIDDEDLKAGFLIDREVAAIKKT